MIPKKDLFNVPIACLPLDEQIMLILRWANMRASKVVCLANVHMLMEAHRNLPFRKILNKADLVTPDGKPLVLMLRQLGIFHQNQVSGMDVFLNLCALAEMIGKPVYFLGSTQEILDKIKRKLDEEFPILKVAGMKSIPFVPIDEIDKTHDTKLIEEVNQSGAGIIFVCLGCPKQEIWMSHYHGKIQGVMVGVGAVFSMYAGITPRAPHWVQHLCLEWLYRLTQEPLRLWKRYASTIPYFMYLATKELAITHKQNSNQTKNVLLGREIETDIEKLDFTPEKIGEIFVRQNIVTREDIRQALLEQSLNPNLKIGEILVSKQLISLKQLKFYLKNQNIQLGSLVLEKKLVRKQFLDKILALQSATNYKLGELLVQQKKVSEDILKEVLIEQYLRRKGLFLIENSSDKTTSQVEQQQLYFTFGQQKV
jgi:N-acetylglucosaminyldiphosphoundecaprenol N-acetyl-beta-D-mannosaminyltransferase